MSKLIVEAITEHYGERCPDFDAECFCCKVWGEYDALVSPAPCDELKTILWGNSVALSRPHDPEVWNRTVASCPRPFYTIELVTRQNAEEVIAAKDARIKELEDKLENVFNK